jgi:benzoyl-CoA reductase/2-hydroxyglutaryl-CoA dehydratase subunit BcrC/BadD/HgdB
MNAMEKLRHAAENPRALMDKTLAEGKKVVLTGPPFVPEEVIGAMGLAPMGVWGGDLQLRESKRYFPAFSCSVAQSILELGISGAYRGASAIVIPSLCDTLKCLGQNWKYAVSDIPFVPMTWPLNRFGEAGREFAKAGIRRVTDDLSRVTGAAFSDEALAEAIRETNAHSAVMRAFASAMGKRPLPAADRAAVYKSARFMPKGEHAVLVRQLLSELGDMPEITGVPVYVTGYHMDGEGLAAAFENSGLAIVGDSLASDGVRYWADAPEGGDGIAALAEKWAETRGASVLYDPGKARADAVVSASKACGARGVVFLQVKFCDPDEFDYVMVKRACDAAGLPSVLVETDRQMSEHARTQTALSAFGEMISA